MVLGVGVALEVGEVLEVDDTHFDGTAPSGRREDFHGIHLVYDGTVLPDSALRVDEPDGTTEAVVTALPAFLTDEDEPVTEPFAVAAE